MGATIGTDHSEPIEYRFDCTTPGGHDRDWSTDPNYTDTVLTQNTTYTYRVQMRDRYKISTGWSGTASATTDRDLDPPTPDPPTFRSAALATDSSIKLEATIGSDITGPIEYIFDCNTPGGHDRVWSTDPNYTDTGLTPSTEYTYTIRMRDGAGNLTGVTSTSVFTLADTTAPEPYIATFSSPPTVTSTTSISMTATPGTDTSGDATIQYRFTETTGNPGGTDRDWSTDRIHEDTDLNPDTEYCYTVQMRDSSPAQTEGAPSAPVCVTTPTDTDPPTPNPATFSSPPAKVSGQNSDSQITMTATVGYEEYNNPVEYYFDEISGNPGATDSGWQTNPNYTDTGLQPNTLFLYTVKMRDALGNETVATPIPYMATTDADKNPPTPNPATFSSPPAAISDSAITMRATTGIDFTLPIMYYFTETSGNPGGSDSGWQENSTYTDYNLNPSMTYSYTVEIQDGWQRGTAPSLEAYATTWTDETAPTPNPATFSLSPIALSDVAVMMRATVGADFNNPIEYLFTELSGESGATSSGWQTDPNYTDTGLTADKQYAYTVQMRDALSNTGTASAIAYVKTDTASIFYVDAASPNNPGGGTFLNPFRTIQDAIDDPNCVDYCEIIVMPGIYTGFGNRDIDFVGKAITIKGTSVYDWDVVASTVIDCQGTEADPHRGFIFEDSEGFNSILEGLTITNGYVNGLTVDEPWAGGAIVITGHSAFPLDTSPTIANCIFYGNSAIDSGQPTFGGAIDSMYASPLIYDCIFYGNVADEGGAIRCVGDDIMPRIVNCTIIANTAYVAGGGVEIIGWSLARGDGQILNCQISGNYSGQFGGGISTLASYPEITNCIITGNYSGEYSGAIDCYDESAPFITNCTISDNTAPLGGGAIGINVDFEELNPIQSAPTMQNCVFTNNSNYAIYEASYNADPQKMINCLFFDNPDGDYWNSTGTTENDDGVGVAVTGAANINDIDGAGGNINNNIDGDPLFIMDAITDARNISGDWEAIRPNDPVAGQTTLVDDLYLVGVPHTPFEPGELVGEFIDAGPSSPYHFRVMANTATEITVVGDTTSVFGSDTYQIVDYRFKTGTSCLDAGAILGAPATDFTGGVRFAEPDIGALEYSEIINITANTVFSTIQDAIDNSVNGDIVEVYDGYYPRTAGLNSAIDLNGKNITLRSVMGPDITIIDAWGDNPDDPGNPIECTVVTFDGSENANCVVEGFTLMGGYKGIAGPPAQHELTAGIYGAGSSASIRNCIVTGNDDGTTISYLHGDILTSYIFDNISPNVADRVVVYNCDGRIAYNLFEDNITGANGELIAHCSGLIENNIIANNIVDAAIFDYCDAVVRNNTIYRNTNTLATFSGTEGVYISNIDWNNTVSGADPGLDVTYTISNVAIPGIGNIIGDPNMADPDNSDYTLLPGSPCLDVADPANHPSDDFVGNPRPVDMTNQQTNLLMPGNIYQDYTVDLSDIVIMLDNWLRTDCSGATPCDGADIYPPGAGDGVIDLMDFSILAEFWLTEDTTFDIGAYELQSNNLQLDMDIWSEQFTPADHVNIEQQKYSGNFMKFMGRLV